MSKKSLSLPLRVGVIGCGNISTSYFKNIRPYSDLVQIAACSDIDLVRAQAKAVEYGIGKAYSVKELLADPDIDAVLNLTLPASHVAVNMQALKAGKHVYCEKPFSLSYKDGLKVLQEARKRKLYLGCAPDTVLGGGIQTCRKLMDDGVIGKALAATANMLGHGMETWHPNPEFYYQHGGGPLFDMGPYYLAALVTMMGPIKSVLAMSKITFKERLITSQPLHGKKIKVTTPTHISGIMEFAQGAICTVTMSFDTWSHHLPMLEVYGTEGSMQCPDPNTFDGEPVVWTTAKTEWTKVSSTHNDQAGRGLGLADMALAIHQRCPNRASGELGLHIVEVMEAFQISTRTGRKVILKSKCRQPAALPPGLPLGKLA